jgi:hypothetical protein
MIEYIAYHGTNSENVESIKINGFKLSSELNDWLGCGIYFFVGGFSCPIENARNWAKNKAFKDKYPEYSILKALVSGNRILDLRVEEDLKIFDELRQHILNRYEEEKKISGKKLHPDTFLCNSVAKSMKLDMLIQNFYIKTKFQRVKVIDSRIPNTTVLCAKESANIELVNIEEIEKGVIENE